MDVQLKAGERILLECYRSLRRALSEHSEDLAPTDHRNSLKALAALWQVANNLDEHPGQLYDLGA